MREEDDDEESAVASGGSARAADARRGSRSEGRLHVAARAVVQPQPRPAQLADNLTRVRFRSITRSLPVNFALPGLRFRHLIVVIIEVNIYVMFTSLQCCGKCMT